jgi:hypothetical protein
MGDLERIVQIECVRRGEYNGSEGDSMSIQLTPQQQKVLDSQEEGPPRVIDPRTNTSYILVREMDYESIRELLEDERRQKAIHALALRNAAGRIDDLP